MRGSRLTSSGVRGALRVRLAIELALGLSLLLVAVIGLVTSVVPFPVVVGALAVDAVVLWRVGQDLSHWTQDRGAVVVPPADLPAVPASRAVPPAGVLFPGNALSWTRIAIESTILVCVTVAGILAGAGAQVLGVVAMAGGVLIAVFEVSVARRRINHEQEIGPEHRSTKP